jgi:hypothetical protein
MYIKDLMTLLQCAICSKFVSRGHLSRHMKIHEESGVIINCGHNNCTYTTKRQENMERHNMSDNCPM